MRIPKRANNRTTNSKKRTIERRTTNNRTIEQKTENPEPGTLDSREQAFQVQNAVVALFRREVVPLIKLPWTIRVIKPARFAPLTIQLFPINNGN